MIRIISKIKNLSLPLKCSFAYMLSSILINGISFLTMPIFTRLLSTNEMGIITTFSSWQTILSAIVTLSLGSASYSVAMVEFKNERDQYESSILVLSSLSCISFFIIYLLFSNQWNMIFDLDSRLMLVMFFGFFLTPATTFWMARQRYEFKYKPILAVTLLSTIISTCCSIAFVLYEKYYGNLDLGTSRIIGKILPEFLIAGLFYVYIFIKGKKYFSPKYWSFALKLSLPLIVHTLSKHILDTSDRIMIDHYWGKSEVGIYGVLYSVSTLSIIIWSAINASLIPVMFEKIRNKKSNEINKIVKPLVLIYGAFASIISILAPEVVNILATEEYYSAIYLMPPIACGVFLTSFYTIFGNYLTYYKKTNLIMISTLGAAIINILLNFLFIPKYGSIAASYTTLVAYIFLSLFQYVSTKIVCKDDTIDFRFLLVCSLLTVGWCLICNILYTNDVIRFVVLGLLFVLFILFWRKIRGFVFSLFHSRYESNGNK